MILFLAVVITRLGKRINEWRVWGMLAVLLRTAGTLCHAEQPEFRYHHLRDRFVMMFVACKRKWPFILVVVVLIVVIVFAPCGHRHGESGNPSLLPAEQNPGMENPRHTRSPADIRSYRDFMRSVPADFSERGSDRVSRN